MLLNKNKQVVQSQHNMTGNFASKADAYKRDI